MLSQRGLRSPRLRNVSLSSQRRLLNHFITHPAEPIPPPPSSTPNTFTLAVKDNIATTSPDLPTTCASGILSKSYKSPIEATIITQLRMRGAVITGKTNLDEFGMGSHSIYSHYGPVSQDDISETSAGGSSGGSAVAVANGEVELALGTDTGGSVRLPAAYTGIVGYKPSYGMISRYGVIPYANSLDTVGFLSRKINPIKDLIVGERGLWKEHDSNDPTSLTVAARKRCAAQRKGYHGQGQSSELKGLKFGIPLEYNIAELDPTIRDAWAAAAKKLQDAGARIVPVSLPTTKHALAAYYVIAPAEASSNLAKYDGIRYGVRDTDASSDASAGGVLYASTRGKGFGEEVKRRILLGSYTLSSEAMDNYFIKAQRVRRLVRRDFNRVFALENPLQERETFELSDLPEGVEMEDKWGPEEVDFLLCPTAPTMAPKLKEVMEQQPVDAYMNDVFTVPASLAGLPAISVPMKVTPEGAAGLQLIGQYWDDARLLDVADAVVTELKL
ncbi:putative mitochondrial glutamyl-tRNA amidotransferase subunit A precursor [Triangularia verruculosa]|uniref:Glutamyl-tRNA(Gln) amidotransferase subunit A, mitochondrial n=1 Tax=Triangularia verruculosa TaxID=2587418 RepID=A0AAN7ASR5_9PEZI|nr:putative mitochondrial glutamyl-tRNA amidotransferase subunit A precursor [Triangularia verruculosa]